MTTALLIFPHQLFHPHTGLQEEPERTILIEEPLFFGDPVYPAKFHRQRLWLHRASMQRYAAELRRAGQSVDYIDYEKDRTLLGRTLGKLARDGVDRLVVCDVHDFILEKRLAAGAMQHGLRVDLLDTPQFINTPQLNREYRDGRDAWFMADFYKWQRGRLNLLVDEAGKPRGGRWSFDDENRKKVPKKKRADVPFIADRKPDAIERKAIAHVNENWPDNPGSLDRIWYPTDHAAADAWLDRFLVERFHLFGDYEDAMVRGESWLWHSVLTPMLNTGLLTPRTIVNRALAFADDHDVPLNALEGFLRQIIGWREFIRASYDDLGTAMRTTNYWNHTRALPAGFYDASTGIAPIDDMISRILETGYCHHIERLMALGGFLFLCETDPDEVYRWFMEMFVDAYDWVMVPNVYAMSQHADGGTITTKPYFCGSNYIRKMSDWTGSDDEGNWAEIWDGLYWRWIAENASKLEKNPRWSMMVAAARRMDKAKMQAHRRNAEAFLDRR